MSFRAKLIGTLLIAAHLLTAKPLGQIEPWRSVDGRHIEARVLEIDPHNAIVRMERSDGLTFTIPWDRLIKEDIERLQKKANGAAPAAPEAGATDDSGQDVIVLPDKWELKDVPMIIQKGNFCVPASATMIAGYHGIKTDQDEVAHLSSEMSATNQGTYPNDMLLAMHKLGFKGESLRWKSKEVFFNSTLPAIRRALVKKGPIYISYRPGVFGQMGHGCVIIGYNDRREEMHFYNPWGEAFKKDYARVAIEAYGVVLIDPPMAAPVATEQFVREMNAVLPKFTGNFLQLSAHLKQAHQKHELVWCSRRDKRDDSRFARNTAREDGRKILELAFERNPAVMIPHSNDGKIQKYYFVTRPPQGGARFLVRVIDEMGWSEPELYTLGSLTRNWASSFPIESSPGEFWELPMIELHPTTSL